MSRTSTIGELSYYPDSPRNNRKRDSDRALEQPVKQRSDWVFTFVYLFLNRAGGLLFVFDKHLS